MNRFLEYANDKPLAEYSPGFVLPYLQTQCKSRSGYAANKERKNLAVAWEWGATYIDGFPEVRNPFKAVKRFPEERSDRYIPPEEDFWKVYSQSSGQDSVLLLACLHLGARKGELFKLKWSDVDLEGGAIRLSTRKTRDGSVRHDWLPMSKELHQGLSLWNESRPYQQAQYVFVQLDDSPSPNNRPGECFICRQHFMKRMCRRAGVKPFGFHAIRHLTAKALYKAGYKTDFIQKVLRHEHPLTTERYLRTHGLDMEELRKGIELFDGRRPGINADFPENENPRSCSHEGLMYTPDVHHQVH